MMSGDTAHHYFGHSAARTGEGARHHTDTDGLVFDYSGSHFFGWGAGGHALGYD